MKDWIFHPFLLIIGNSKSFKKFFSSFEISLKGRCKERLSKSSGTTQKDKLHLFLSKIHDIFCLIYIEIITLTNILKSLYSYRIEINYFCHNTQFSAKIRVFNGFSKILLIFLRKQPIFKY